IDMNLEIFQSSHLDESQLSLFHEKDYIDFVKGKSAYGEGYLDGGDTPCYRGVHESSTRVVNDTLSCASKIIEGLAEHGFNPSGGLHHAFPNRAAGFCVFNDIGVLINFIRSHYKLRRILYIDIDAHHGDGVYYPFESDPDVLILDIHEDGKFLFPGTGGPEERGKGAASGTKRNICLPPGASGDTLIDAMDKSEDYLRESSAEFVILQCGADGLEGDPITHLMYSPDAYDEVIQRVHEISHRICSGKLLLLGGGGYDIENASSAWLRAVKTVLFER
ncbi:MAG: acetoin utilization protein AcuC, partial [Nitrososphaerales archaeon]